MSEALPAITFLTTGLSRGGAETQLVRVAREFALRGSRIEVICLGSPGVLSRGLEEAGISVFYLGLDPKRPNPLALWHLVARLRASKPRVLVCFMFHANVAGRIAGRLAGIPAIVTSIRNEYFGGRLREALERWTEPLGHVVTTNSAMVAESLRRRRIVRGELEVVPNCLAPLEAPSAERTAQLREDLGATADDFLWLAVGSLEPQKDVSGLLEAFASLLQARPEARLAIAGEGSLAGALERQIERRGIAGRVRLLGLRSDVPALLAAADAYVLSSAWESSPNSLLEAAMSGVPAVSTDVGGVREIVTETENGLLVPPRDAAALADAMRRMMEMPADERRRMGGAHSAELRERSSVPRVVDRWEQVFRDTLARQR